MSKDTMTTLLCQAEFRFSLEKSEKKLQGTLFSQVTLLAHCRSGSIPFPSMDLSVLPFVLRSNILQQLGTCPHGDGMDLQLGY